MSIAVAWGCALWSPLGEAVVIVDGAQAAMRRAEGIPADRYVMVSRRASPVLAKTILQWHVPGESNVLWVFDAGWPFGALSAQVNLEEEVRGGIRSPAWLRPRSHLKIARPLPLVPLWPGSLANTAVAAIALYLVTLAPFQIRRFIRRRRDRCPRCGYDLSGADHERCPECGAEARR